MRQAAQYVEVLHHSTPRHLALVPTKESAERLRASRVLAVTIGGRLVLTSLGARRLIEFWEHARIERQVRADRLSDALSRAYAFREGWNAFACALAGNVSRSTLAVVRITTEQPYPDYAAVRDFLLAESNDFDIYEAARVALYVTRPGFCNAVSL